MDNRVGHADVRTQCRRNLAEQNPEDETPQKKKKNNEKTKYNILNVPT